MGKEVPVRKGGWRPAMAVWAGALALLAGTPALQAGPAAPAVPQAGLAAPAAPQAAPAAPAAPPRMNLAVEWRWSEATPRRPGNPGTGAAGAAGAVITSTAGSTTPPQGQVTLRAGAVASASALPALPARVIVANGGGARVRLAEAVPMHAVQAWQEPGGTGAALIPGWSESVQALEVRVRWPGGRSPAEIEVDVEQAVAPAPDGSNPAARRERLATRAWVPLGEWVTVAAWGDAAGGPGARPADPGTVSTTALGARTARVLQLRLSELHTP